MGEYEFEIPGFRIYHLILYSNNEVSDTGFKIQIKCFDLKVKLVGDMRKFRKIWQLLDPTCHGTLKFAAF